jgi:hypothetical protein
MSAVVVAMQPGRCRPQLLPCLEGLLVVIAAYNRPAVPFQLVHPLPLCLFDSPTAVHVPLCMAYCRTDNNSSTTNKSAP